MPKIIKDVEQSVFKAVMDVVTSEEIDQLSMKRIAKSSGIAVGTLYNYFPDREDLVSKAILYSWNQSFQTLDAILAQSNDSIAKWTTFHETLYLEMMKRKGVGHELIRQQVISDEVNQEILDGLSSRYRYLFEELSNATDKTFSEQTRRRIQETLVSTVLRLTITFPDDDQANRDYLKQFTRVILTIADN
ncbi:DNA-binding transcriptional regulator, AcrR family [Marinilactibacillus piezotolerans]|uniref:DNA-binding transcriptional regulator, AcrR family n=1 Tax=Marinilactibacillus piezotolerans TaxID=258723 RepID=A0A1I3ZU62_9LACT|nr:TetR/AcrR family transcriptional regulator [Marinilactibacillus piezotolerans]SFK47714.1 DNA-binding transcriptional regulator, AcrR family [Marinilactibacillus piezotolerans]